MKRIVIVLVLMFSTTAMFAQKTQTKEFTCKVSDFNIKNGEWTIKLNGKNITVTDPDKVIEKAIKPMVLVPYQEVTFCKKGNAWVITKFNCMC